MCQSQYLVGLVLLKIGTNRKYDLVSLDQTRLTLHASNAYTISYLLNGRNSKNSKENITQNKTH